MNVQKVKRRDSRLCSPRAYAIFRFSAWWTIALGLFFALMMLFYNRLASSHLLVVVRIVGGCLGAVGSVAGLIIFGGMLAYLVTCDRSSRWRKALWLVVFLLIASFGSSVYFFAVYRKHVSGD